jgi:hypothetical protein
MEKRFFRTIRISLIVGKVMDFNVAFIGEQSGSAGRAGTVAG